MAEEVAELAAKLAVKPDALSQRRKTLAAQLAAMQQMAGLLAVQLAAKLVAASAHRLRAKVAALAAPAVASSPA